MKISEFIQKLEALKATEGDVDVFNHGYSGYAPVCDPRVAHLRTLNKRESVQRTWVSYEPEDRKGAKVVVL